MHLVIALARTRASLSVAQANAQSLTPPQRTIPAPATVSPALLSLSAQSVNDVTLPPLPTTNDGWLPYRIPIGFFGVFLATISYTGIAIWRRKGKARRLTVRPRLPATLALLIVCISAHASHAQSALLPLTHNQVQLIRKIEGRLMAPCCYTQTIRDHDSQVALQMRDQVTAFVAAGQSEQEIVTYYRTKYGETILVVPDGLEGQFLTILPIFAFLLSVAVLVMFIRRSVSSRDKHIAQIALAGVADERADLKRRIRDELGDF